MTVKELKTFLESRDENAKVFIAVPIPGYDEYNGEVNFIAVSSSNKTEDRVWLFSDETAIHGIRIQEAVHDAIMNIPPDFTYNLMKIRPYKEGSR